MTERVLQEVLALRELAQKGGYKLGCDTCGNEPSLVRYALPRPGEEPTPLKVAGREVFMIRKGRICESCQNQNFGF